jgi:outer membrane protein OmpA-like peptidoglycan-associated protein
MNKFTFKSREGSGHKQESKLYLENGNKNAAESTKFSNESVPTGEIVNPAEENRQKKRNLLPYFELLIYASAVALTTFLVAVILREASGRELPIVRTYPTVANQVPPPPSVVINTTKPTISIFFKNGSLGLTGEALRRIRSFSQAINACGDAEFSLTGWSSSAPFINENEEMNLALANNRAEKVAQVINSEIESAKILINRWDVFGDLDIARHYIDFNITDKSRRLTEYLNRRVDIEVLHASCRINEKDIQKILYIPREKGT